MKTPITDKVFATIPTQRQLFETYIDAGVIETVLSVSHEMGRVEGLTEAMAIAIGGTGANDGKEKV